MTLKTPEKLKKDELFPWARLRNVAFSLSGFKKALLQNPREMIRGQIFSGMIRIQARKSEIQAESRSYRPKVGDTAQNPNRIAQKRAPNGV